MLGSIDSRAQPAPTASLITLRDGAVADAIVGHHAIISGSDWLCFNPEGQFSIGDPFRGTLCGILMAIRSSYLLHSCLERGKRHV